MDPEVARARPAARLGALDAITITVGVVVGVGIFSAPAIVAAGVGSEREFVALWALGGVLSVIGALCYGELVASFPSAGGEYSLLHRAFGPSVAFLFAWARLTVIGTGSIALLAYVFGDHLSAIAPLGAHGNTIYAAGLVLVLVAINVLGLRFGTAIQKVLTSALVAGLLVMVVSALRAPADAAVGSGASAPTSTLGLAMVFVLLTYGGWNEAAYLSAEVRGGARRMALTIVASVGLIGVLYVLVNVAYVHLLGLDGVRSSPIPGASAMGVLTGTTGVHLASTLVAAAALTSMNATLLTVSRTAYALGRDVHVLRWLGRWDARSAAPIAALLALGGIALALVVLGGIARRGFATMVEFTAPVFWTFFLLTGASLFVLRVRHPDAARPFRVPLYPVTPLVFCATCAWLLHASLAYTQIGALAGVLVLAVGSVPLALERRARRSQRKESPP